jgi:hypothetical protein
VSLLSEWPVEVAVAEQASGVEPLTHFEKVIEARVRERQLLHLAGGLPARVRAPCGHEVDAVVAGPTPRGGKIGVARESCLDRGQEVLLAEGLDDVAEYAC